MDEELMNGYSFLLTEKEENGMCRNACVNVTTFRFWGAWRDGGKGFAMVPTPTDGRPLLSDLVLFYARKPHSRICCRFYPSYGGLSFVIRFRDAKILSRGLAAYSSSRGLFTAILAPFGSSEWFN